MNLIPGPARRALRRARMALGDHPAFLPVVLALTPQRMSRAITARTELVVEGFPRCGNTFLVAAIELAEGRDVAISSHVHVPAQVKLAVRRGLPTIVVIRDPLDAVASLMVAAPHIRPRSGLEEFAHHYNELLAYRDRVVVATFEEITRDTGAVIDAVNQRFRTSFAHFDHTPDNVAAAFAAVDARFELVHGHRTRALPRPSTSRGAASGAAREQLTRPAVAAALERARAVYKDFIE